ncbi:hypothetical protein BT96DRAFT_986487 [Gymnopus androsaceus JB14]|uniref:Uncharacterized protein n=1 Tax=Gymnopus androsaceus JB14 TaxID=1447944 RepID=A0A6A4IFA5_9AGAR|nr:hypothetical protein BT96DRAFT_986487 [Gymnopus androsaceus JB14]
MDRVATKKREKDCVHVEKQQVAQEKVQQVGTRLFDNISVLEDALKLPARAPGYLSVAEIDLQLDWYIQNRPEFTVPKKTARGNRDAKCELLKEAVTKSMTYSAQLPSGSGQQ